MNETHDAAGTYAIGALPPDAVEAFERHLTTCRVCREETAGFREAAAELALLAAAPPPPDDLRSTVLGAVEHLRQLPPAATSTPSPEPRPVELVQRSTPDELAARRANRRARVLTLLVAAVSVVALALGGAVYTLSHPGQAPAVAAADTSLLAAPDARIVPTTLTDGTHVSFVVSPSQNRAMFVADRLPDPGPDRVFQLWTIHDGRPAPDSTVAGGDDVAQWFHGQVAGAGGFAVTIEPVGGSARPTSPVLASASI